MGARLEWLTVLTVLACADRPEPAPVPSAQADMALPQADPESTAIERIRRQLPPGVLVRANACPFECCVYGEWRADTVIPMYGAPRARGTPMFSIPKGTRMRADSGVVFVTGIAFAVVEDTVFRYANRTPWLLPNDTLVLLDPIGEGYWTAWRRGEVLKEVPPFFESVPEPKRGYLVGTPRREWWVRASVEGQSGWFPADSVRVSGADACGGP